MFISWAVFVRFYNITQIGLEGDDVFWYWKMAQRWCLGNLELTAGYRPITNWTYSIGMSLFGINDYAIKILNSIINLGTGILIYLCAYKTIRNRFISLLSSIVYLSLPFVIIESRSELTHILSTFYYLLSYLFFIQYIFIKKTDDSFYKYLYLSLSGFFLGMTAHVHPDLATLGLPYVIFISIVIFYEERGQSNFKQNFKNKLFLEVLVFTLSYLSVFFIILIKFGLISSIRKLLGGIGHQHSNILTRSNLTSFSRYFVGIYEYISHSISPTGSLLFIFSIFSAVYFKIKKIKKPIIIYLPMILVIFHLLTCVFVVQRKFIFRLAHPSVPFILISILYWISSLIKLHQIKFEKTILMIIALIIMFFSGVTIYDSNNYKIKIYRNVYNILGSKVNKNNRLLVTPSLFHWYREGFKSPVYFNKNAVYLSQYRHRNWKFKKNILENFKHLINVNNIRYILIAKNDKNVRKTLYGHPDAKSFLRNMYGISTSSYSLKWEYKELKNIVSSLNAELVTSSNAFDIYKLRAGDIR